MDINYLIQILQNKITILTTAKGQSFASGNIDQMNLIEKDILDTQNTFNQLTMLVDMAQAAKAANSTAAEVVASGLDAVQNVVPDIQGPSASAVINGYDISAYATDPLYEDKIRTILSRMPTFSVVSDIDMYIQSVAQGSFVTGDVVYKAAQQYGVDLQLMMAIMQNDSQFGTDGVGARTNNPGNVGNTGTSTQTFPSWSEGISAVADWLNRHRVVVPTTDNQPIPVVTIVSTTTSSISPVNDPVASVDVNPSSPSIVYVPEIVPTTPVVATTTNATFLIPTANATTTPVVDVLVPVIDQSTTTPDVVVPDTVNTDATTTSSNILDLNSGNVNATSTPSMTASSTQAVIVVKKKRKLV